MKQEIKTKIHYYYFDVSNNKEKKEYKELLKVAKQKTGLQNPDTYHYINFGVYPGSRYFIREKIKHLKTVTLETKHVFSNQWNTKEGLRVFDWRENEFQNRDIKEGYYLEITDEIKQLRNDLFKCGYCGKQYYKTKRVFCDDCLSSAYLSESDLKLLRLRTVNDNTDFKELTEKEKQKLMPIYIKGQINGDKRRTKERLEKQRQKIEKSYKEDSKNAKTEYKGFSWLMDNNIDIENVIFYSHTDLFCFGWRNELSFEVEQELKKALKDFPFKYEMKVA